MADLSTTKVYGDLTVTNNIKGYTITNLSDVSVVYETRTVTAGTGLTGGGALSNNVTLSLTAGFGDTVNPYASKTANWFLAAPNGTAGSPTFRAIVAADVPTLNQSTTGQAGSVANALTMNNSGSGAASGSTYNGSAAVTISYNSVGALSSSTTSTQSGYFGDIYLWDDSTPSHYLQITNSANLTAARTLSINVNDANRTISLAGDVTTAGAFATSGAYALTLTTTAATNVTLPTTGTLATLAGAESLTNKKLGSLATNGPVYTSNGDGTLNSETTLAASRGGTGVSNSYTLTITGANKTLAGAGGTLTLGASPTINGSGTLALTSNATFTTALTVNTGAVTISGQSGGSTLNLPTSLTVNALTSGHVLYASAANTISGEASLSTSRGGTGTTTTLTQGSVVFAGASGVYTQDNANFFWDDTSNELGIGTATPYTKIEAAIAPTVKTVNPGIAVTSTTTDAIDMIGTGTGYLFRQYYYDATTPAPVTSGRIAVVTETNWTSTAATQDSKMIFSTTLDGTLTDRVYLNSAGEFGIGAIVSGQLLNVAGAARIAGNLTLNSSSPEILFNDTGDSGVDMAIKATSTGTLEFYQPEDGNKIQFKILDDTGVDAIYGYSVNGSIVVTSARVAQNMTWNGSTIGVGYGGTGTAAAPTQGGVIYASSTSAYASTAAGSSGQVLLSGGTGSPTWTSGTMSIASGKSATFTNSLTVSGADKTFNGTGTSLTINDQITIGSLTANHVLYASADDTISSEAQLAATRGGTGYGSYTVGDILYASTTTALSRLNAVATGNALISGGAGVAPSWGKIGLTTHISGTLAVGNGGTGATTFTAGQLLYGNDANAISTSANLTWTNASSLFASASSTSNTYAASSASLANPEGATITAKNTNSGDGKLAAILFQSANASGLYSTVYMGVLSTTAGYTSPFVIGRRTGANAYTESLRINESGDVSILSTTASSSYTTGSLIISGGVGIAGAITLNSTINKVTITAPASGSTLTIADGKTLTSNVTATFGAASTYTGSLTIRSSDSTARTLTLATDIQINAPTQWGVIYGSSTTAYSSTGAGSTGQILRAVTSGAPIWSTPTFPNTAASGKFLYGDGTNWVESTSTIPTSAGSTAGKYLVSDGTNYVLSTYTLTLGANTTINTSSANYAAYYSGTNTISGEAQLAVSRGGTGIGSYAVGDIIYASGSTTLAKLADIATGNALISGGVTMAPSWGKIGLTTHISGTLAVGNGGTGATTLTSTGILVGNGTSAISAPGPTLSATTMTFGGAGTINSTSTNALTLDSGSTGAVNLGTNANAKTVTIGNATGATGVVVNSGTNGVTFNQVAAGIFKIQASAAPTTDMVQITNTGYGTTTAGVNGLSVTYVGGSAAVEASAVRVDITPGGTSGGTWNTFKVVSTAAAASGVTMNVLKVDNKTAGAGTSNIIYAGTGYDNIINYNGTTVINGSGQLNLGTVTGTLAVGNGGTGTATAFTQGSVVFAGASGAYTQDNAAFFWDDTNNRLGIGTATPISKLQLGSNWVNNPGGGTTSVYLGTAGFAAAYVVPEMIITTSTANTTPATIGLALHNANNTAGAYAPLLVFSKTETGATAYNSSIAAIGARTVTGSGATDSWIDGDLMFYTSPTAGSGLLERMRIAQNGNVGINTISPGFTLEVNGAFAATTKSFIIPHPLKEGKRLCYGSLESPYHGVRLTGRAKVTKGRVTVELPDYLYKLVKEDAVNIQLTNIKHDKVLWVERVDLEHNLFEVGYATKLFDKKEYEFYWDLTAIRKDIPDLQVEI